MSRQKDTLYTHRGIMLIMTFVTEVFLYYWCDM